MKTCLRRFLALLALSLAALAAACSVVNAPDDAVPPDEDDGGPGGAGGGMPAGGAGGGACTDVTSPTVISDSGPLSITDTTITYVLELDEPVTLGANAIGIDNGATVSVTPALPATGTTFTVEIGSLVFTDNYTLTLRSSAVEDACGNALAGDFTVALGPDCNTDTQPPTVTSPLLVSLTQGTTMANYALTFDEPVIMSANALSVLGSATAAVTPALPATHHSFSVDLTNMDGGTGLQLSAAEITDVCGNAMADDVVVEICPGGTAGTVTFNYTGQIVTWTVPVCTNGTFTIEAFGAEGGFHTSSTIAAGLGARMRGDFQLQPGDTLKILVGGQPSNSNGGGGGSFVTDATNAPLVIAGGGGGGSTGVDSSQKHGRTTTTGGAGASGGGGGGANGNGGGAGTSPYNSGGGGGLLTNGANGSNTGGGSFVSGGAAGGNGGFGGGGGGSAYVVGGGGGGYSGGGGGGNLNSQGGVGGGGGSINNGVNQSNSTGVRTGHGMVTISW